MVVVFATEESNISVLGTRCVATGRDEPTLFSEPFSQNVEETPEPKNFREAEVFGLRLMQEGEYELALKGKYRCRRFTPSSEHQNLDMDETHTKFHSNELEKGITHPQILVYTACTN